MNEEHVRQATQGVGLVSLLVWPVAKLVQLIRRARERNKQERLMDERILRQKEAGKK